LIKKQGSVDYLTNGAMGEISKNRFSSNANTTLYKTDAFSSHEKKTGKIRYDAAKHLRKRDVKGNQPNE
jgi:hypothetical protein